MSRLRLGCKSGEVVVIQVPGAKPIRVQIDWRGLTIEADREVTIDREKIYLAKLAEKQS